jgi:hypothetical protein
MRTVGPRVWDGLEEAETAQAGVKSFLLAGAENLSDSGGVPAGCMSMLAGVADEWPQALVDATSSGRLECQKRLRSRLSAAVATGELPQQTDVDRLSRFYLGVFQGMAIQAKDGATTTDLEGVAETAMDAWPKDRAQVI